MQVKQNRVLIFFMVAVLVSCSPKELWKTKAIELAVSYSASRLDSARVYTDSSGVVSIGDSILRYVIHPDAAFRGMIDPSLNTEQILVSIDSLHDPYLVPVYHLLLKYHNDSLQIQYIVQSDMRVLEIRNGIIVAEIPTHDPSSPLYYCSECRDTVRYKMYKGKILLLDPVLD